jgi:ribokinase
MLPAPNRKRVALSSFATLDYVISTPAPITGPATWLCDMHTNSAWPRAGGAALYAGKALAANGHDACPIVALGDDPHGEIYANLCLTAGINTAGIARKPDSKSPTCLLIYHDSGGYTCLLEAGTPTQGLTPEQTLLIEGADLVVIAAAPAAVTTSILMHTRPAQRLAWITKADPACFPADLCARLSQRADLIFCNTSERTMISPAGRTDQIVIETQGEHGALATRGSEQARLGINPVDVADATGAGDTFAGAALSQYLYDERDLTALLQAGTVAASALLIARADT